MFNIDSSINRDAKLFLRQGSGFFPSVVTSPREELLACRETAWIGSFLNISPVYDISGADAVKLLNYVCVNRDFSKLKIGGSRHALMCNDKGQLLADGLIIRRDEQTFRTYWLAPVLAFYADTLGMDVKGTWIRDEYFFQIDGPKSLQILEKATKTDLHDIKFAQKRNVQIAGTNMTIIRLGMSGSLAYEVHGDIKNADLVFETILNAGEEFGIKRLGFNTYCRNHTQGGYPNQWIHYWYPLFSSGSNLSKYISSAKGLDVKYSFLGSASDEPENAFVTPFELSWDYLIDYNHDFIGKEALLKIRENPLKKCVTLEWNAEDVGTVFASQFMGRETKPFEEITSNGDGGEAPFIMSKVMFGDKMIGMTSGRIRDYYHQTMISLAFIEKEYAVEGKELTVLWGTDETCRMKIRAKVAAFPYFNEEYRNETYDVRKIPYQKN